MSNTTDTGGSILGATSGVASAVTGVAALPNTGGNLLVTVFAIVAIGVGTIVIASFVASRLAGRFLQ